MMEILGYGLMALMVGLLGYSVVESARSRSRLSARVRETASARRCARCGGPFRAWDGQLLTLTDFRHINAGVGGPSLVHQIRLWCAPCRDDHDFLVLSDGTLTDLDLIRFEAGEIPGPDPRTDPTGRIP